MKRISSILIILIFVFIPTKNYSQNTNGNWTIKGPVVFPQNATGQINGMGRVVQIKFHPTNNQKIYAVSASGGLWISNDAGVNWEKTPTDNEIPQNACSSICLDPTDENILYLSTGDPNYYGNGSGIYKSTNGGVTWSLSNNGIGNSMAMEMIMCPTDHNTIIAAATDGIWKTTDAGATWTQKLSDFPMKDIEYKPNSNHIVYSVGENKFWKSIDNGETWIEIATINPANGGGGKISTTVANENVVYVGFVGSNTTTAGGIIYKSNDSGDTFTVQKPDNTPNLNGYAANDPGQGFYNWDIFADRDNENILYAVGHVVWKSTDAGEIWLQLTDWPVKCHTDMHQILSSPYNHSKIFNMNDGGIFTSTDGGNEWTPSCDGLSATEVYHFGQSKLSRNIVSLGSQDNGEIILNDTTWTCIQGGDWGSVTSFDYSQPNVAYYAADGNRKDLSNYNGQSLGLTSPSNDDNYVFSNLNTSFALISQGVKLIKTQNLLSANPNWSVLHTFSEVIKSVAISPNNINEIYVVLANKKVYYSSNGSTFILVSSTPTDNNVFSKIAIDKNNSNIVYVSCNEKMYRSQNKAVSWTDITGTLSNTDIIGLINNPYSTDESMYIATSFGIYYRNNTMIDWQSFSSGLPQIASISDLIGYFDGTTNSVLRVSFYGRGVWESDLYSPVLSNNQYINNLGTITIYPNPSTDIITLNITQPELMNTTANLFDENGKMVMEVKIKEPITLLDFKSYAKGIYLLKFSNNVTKKIIIK